MIFRVFKKTQLERLFGVLSSANKVVGPVKKAQGAGGKPLYAFEPVEHFGDLDLGFTTTKLPAKRFFLPFVEDFATFDIKGGDWQKHPQHAAPGPVVFFGMHACDINALNKLDKVLLQSDYPMPHYASRRANMFIVGYDCAPQPWCFCRSMGSDTALHGFDLFLTDLGDVYFAEIQTDTAFNFLRQIEVSEPQESHHSRYMKKVAERNAAFTTHVDTTDLTKILDMEFQSDVWKYWGERCLSCGSCSSVCPTCYCYGISESVDIDLKGARKTKRLHSCNLIDFAEVAGGHNFRPTSHGRLKYRYYHKHRGFVEAFEESLCVGCGRCGLSCLAGITVPEVIASVRGEEAAKWKTR